MCYDHNLSFFQLRPPQPAVYLFLLDVSFNAVETGKNATDTQNSTIALYGIISVKWIISSCVSIFRVPEYFL